MADSPAEMIYPAWRPGGLNLLATRTAISRARVTGRVVWGGQPVADVPIQLKAPGNFYQLPVVAETRTNENGIFVLSNAPAGVYMLYAVAPNPEFWEFNGRDITVPDSGQVSSGTFELAKRLTLLEPPNNSEVTEQPVVLRWEPFPGAERFEVQVLDRSTGTQVFADEQDEWSETVNLPLEPGKTYEWSVAAFDADGNRIAYYSSFYFTVR
jgi:hypothetical protein